MSANVVNQVPYLRTSRNFPLEAQPLSVEMNKSYVDVANAVNSRTIGIYTVNRPVVNGEAWFITEGQKQQAFRQIYNISSTAAFNHGLNFQNIERFTVIRGIGFDGTSYYPIPYVSPVAAADSIGIFVTSTQVQITTGAGSPALTQGTIILEWLSQV